VPRAGAISVVVWGGIYHEPWRASAGVRCQGRWRAPRFQRRPVGSYHDDVAV